MSLLVTGGAGFIGSNFLLSTCSRLPSISFTCIDKLNYVSDNSTKFISPLLNLPNFTFIQADLSTDYDLLYRLIVTEERFTDIINFAAESSVDKSFNDPLFFTRNNILATQNLLECVRLLGKKRGDPSTIRFVHISTDEVYGEQISSDRADENSRLNPSNPYSATKAAIDLIINAYMKSYHVPVTVIRSNNVYGYNQYEEKLIPMVISSLSNDKAVTIQGDGHNKRRYLFIDDFTEAVLTIWKKGEAYEIYNVGSEDEKSNNEIVEMIIDVWGEQNGKKDVDITYVKDREFNDERYEVDFEKVRRLGWVAKVGLREGLSRVVRGHRGWTEVPGPLLK